MVDIAAGLLLSQATILKAKHLSQLYIIVLNFNLTKFQFHYISINFIIWISQQKY